MPWVRIDDGFAQHPKVVQAGPLALALQVAGLCYCNRNLTDGFIPWSAARSLISWEFLGKPEPQGRLRFTICVASGMAGEDVDSAYVIDILLANGMWEEVDGGYRIHDYEDYQPLKAQVESEREQKQAAGKAGGQASAEARAKAGGQAKSNPGPVPGPVPLEQKEEKSDQVSTRARTSWKLTETFVSRMFSKYGDVFTEQDVRDKIAVALSHKNSKKYPNPERYIDVTWLGRDAKERRNGQPLTREDKIAELNASQVAQEKHRKLRLEAQERMNARDRETP